MNENNSSINLYAQLAIAAENRAKESRPSLSAGAVLNEFIQQASEKTWVFFWWILEFTYDIRNGFKNQLRSILQALWNHSNSVCFPRYLI